MARKRPKKSYLGRPLIEKNLTPPKWSPAELFDATHPEHAAERRANLKRSQALFEAVSGKLAPCLLCEHKGVILKTRYILEHDSLSFSHRVLCSSCRVGTVACTDVHAACLEWERRASKKILSLPVFV